MCQISDLIIPQVGLIILLIASISTLKCAFCYFNEMFGGKRDKQMFFISPLDQKVQHSFVKMVHAHHKQVREVQKGQQKITSNPTTCLVNIRAYT